MNDIDIIGSALQSRLTTQGTIPARQNIVTGQGTVQPPYCIFSMLSAVDAYTFTDEEADTEYVVKVVSNRQTAGEAQALYGRHIHPIVQDAPLSMPGGVTLLRCRRRSRIEYQDPQGFWHVGGIYRIEIMS